MAATRAPSAHYAGVFACADVPAAAAGLIALVQGYFAVAATARDVIPSGSAARTTIRMVEPLVGAKLIPGRTNVRARSGS